MTPVTTAQEHARLTLTGPSGPVLVEVHEVDGREALSELFRFEITGSTSLSPNELVGLEAALELRDGAGRGRTIRGLVSKAWCERNDRSAGADDAAVARLVLRPRAYLLSIGQGCRVYHDRSAVQIAATLLTEHGCAVRDETAARDPRAYTAQYREDDWSFLSRLCEEDGVYLRFEHGTRETTAVLCDSSGAAPDLEGGAAIRFAPESGQTTGEEQIYELSREVRTTPDRYTIASYDPLRPDDRVTGSTSTQAKGGRGFASELEVYWARAGGPRASEACSGRAEVASQRSGCRRRTFTGASTSARIEPGRRLLLSGHPDHDGRYFVTSVVHALRQRVFAQGELRPLTARFEAVGIDTPFRPPQHRASRRDEYAGLQEGLQTAVVVGEPGAEVFPDAHGRVRLQHHWDREGRRDHTAGTWMRVAQRGSAGSLSIPRVGWNVVTFNEEGAICAPSVLSRLHDAEHPPAYSLPDHKTRTVFRTATTPSDGSTNEIRFEDKSGAEEMFLNASRDMNILVHQDKSESIQQDHGRSVGADHRMAVCRTLDHGVGGHQKIQIGGSEHIELAGDGGRNVGKDEHIAIGGSRQVKTGGGHTTSVKGTRKLRVGAALVDASVGGIAASSGKDHIVAVGGGIVRAAKGSIEDGVGKVGVQLVGAVRLESAKGDYILKATKSLSETVVGVCTLRAGGDLLEATHNAKLKAGRELSLMGRTVHIKATEKIEARVGESALTILPDSIRLEGPTLVLDGSSTIVSTAPMKSFNS